MQTTAVRSSLHRTHQRAESRISVNRRCFRLRNQPIAIKTTTIKVSPVPSRTSRDTHPPLLSGAHRFTATKDVATATEKMASFIAFVDFIECMIFESAAVLGYGYPRFNKLQPPMRFLMFMGASPEICQSEATQLPLIWAVVAGPCLRNATGATAVVNPNLFLVLKAGRG